MHMDNDTSPPWIHLLTPVWQGWREDQILKGRDPDPYIERKLREDGLWPDQDP